MYMKNIFLLLSWLILLPSGILANPIKGMLERIDKGASNKFVVELHKSERLFRVRPERRQGSDTR